ncbi:inorganic phosphate transporter [Ascoidea rubescens DSM 1968]|uniref:Phosphate transporter n=1 Tax=Ascoidea rubescens DSM 1968 TaxID=1344418 RepID=A0A1D2VE97_9ASCO|nr:phosphate transporter [Ascoidea rubescens DSM 1968]ODV60028.1 phosphate transporter [Ascoidea rubescens DSM 1968]
MVYALHDFDYLFGLTIVFAFLDAWNIGANDVANSFASSVSSRSLTYPQAMILAAIAEFLGAVLAGSRVADTIRTKILDVSYYDKTPAVLLLTMTCALIGSSTWLTIATKIGMPVSTTHSIVGGIIGAGIAAGSDIHWGWEGFSQIVASWFIAPLIAGGFAAIIFLISKYAVLERKHALRNALFYVPCLVYFTFSILTMLIVWKGAPQLKLDKLSTGTIIAAIFGVGAVAAAIYMIILFPFFKRKLVYEDWRLRKWEIIKGPYYYFKSTDDIPPMPAGHHLTIDYYKGRRYDDGAVPENNNDPEVVAHNSSTEFKQSSLYNKEENALNKNFDDIEVTDHDVNHESKLEETLTTKQLWFKLLKNPLKWPKLIWLVFIHGITQDIISNQVHDKGVLAGNLKNVHVASKIYDNKVEYLFSILQAVTATAMSFAHGSNDISNAAGPLSTVYLVWKSNAVASKSDVPIWVLCFTASALVIGLWIYGYHIMGNLGNKLILQSPSRGFSLELGTAITVVLASQLAIPVSTTQSAVGATVSVGLCNKSLKSVNWRMVLWIYLGWIITLPSAGLVAGIIMGIIINAPRWSGVYGLSN